MNISEQIDLVEAAIKVSDFFSTDVDQLLFFTTIGNKKKIKEWNKIVKTVKNFYKSDIHTRARMMGLTIKKVKSLEE
jgi:hypothetical protein